MGGEDLYHAIAVLAENAQAYAAIGAELARHRDEVGLHARGANEGFRAQGVMRAVEKHHQMLYPALRLVASVRREIVRHSAFLLARTVLTRVRTPARRSWPRPSPFLNSGDGIDRPFDLLVRVEDPHREADGSRGEGPDRTVRGRSAMQADAAKDVVVPVERLAHR